MADTPTGQYAADAPIRSRVEDRFNRWQFAARIADVIATRQDPSSLVIGIYGPWGDGKTSVLNMMREALADKEDVIAVAFNPWHFEREEQLIRGFFNELAAAIGKKLTTRKEEIGKVLRDYGGFLSVISLEGAADSGEKMSSVDLEELKARIGTALVESGKRVIVFIDDIDRLDKRDIHAVLKLVKLSGSFSNTAYVLAFDDEVVAASLGERYGAGDAAAGRSFLEKIIQVPLHLPDAEAVDIQTLTFEGVDEVLGDNSIKLSREDVEAFVRHFSRGILPEIRTPRQVKRYINAIRFAVPLLKGEVNIIDQLLIEGLRSVYPDVYLSIRSNQDVYLGEGLTIGRDDARRKETIKRIVADGMRGLSESAQE
jgi:predicted KAP-like P-loop ATPase